MRLKLVLICSVIAAVVGTGSAIAIILSVFSSLRPITTPGMLVVSSYLLPTLSTLLASIFVYRHTARRRRLQAFLTAIISLILTILLFVLASIVTARRQPVQPLPSPIANTRAWTFRSSQQLGRDSDQLPTVPDAERRSRNEYARRGQLRALQFPA